MPNDFSQGNQVERHTSDATQERIRSMTIANIDKFSKHRGDLDRRIKRLGDEWDIERYLDMNASALSLTGVILGAFVNRKWLLLPAAVLGFLFQHAVQGWCPPLPIFRSLGKRTKREIEIERNALKALRGDFEAPATIVSAFEAARKV